MALSVEKFIIQNIIGDHDPKHPVIERIVNQYLTLYRRSQLSEFKDNVTEMIRHARRDIQKAEKQGLL